MHPAPFAYWINLRLPVVAGEPITPLQRVTAAADYANGGFATLRFEEWSFRSLDLTVQMAREPQGEWIGVTVDSLAGTTAIGLGDSELYDTDGRIGRSVASILVEPR
jgi:Thioesterase-like superfamily